MTLNRMLTRWLDEEISPSSYQDVTAVAKLGSKARSRLVRFEWSVSVEEAIRLRQAAHFWGSYLQGRFRTFESRILAAINLALDEPWSVYKLWPSGQADYPELQVEAHRSGDAVLLSGQASFPVIFTYGLYAAKALNPPNYWFEAIRLRLGLEFAERIKGSVEQLGWDMSEMASPRLQPALNKIYGVAADYEDTGTSIEMTDCKTTQHIKFFGPFHWRRTGPDPCLFEAPEGKQGGIYLWTVKVGDETRVHYVGQSRRSFRQRTTEHLNAYLSSEYKILDPDFLIQGGLRTVWEGSSAFKDAGERIEEWCETWMRTTPNLCRLMDSFRLYLAPFDGDRRMHERLEGALGAHYLCHETEAIREFLEPGSRFRPRTIAEDPIRFTFETSSPIAGFPSELPV